MIQSLLTITLIAVATAMDAFSVGLSMGMYKLTKKRVFFIGLVIGLFHVIMPLLGMIAGDFLSNAFGEVASYLAAALLFFIGFQMLRQLWIEEKKEIIAPRGIGLFLFALSVSLDSFSVAITLGMSGYHLILVLINFGLVAAIFTWSGLIIGTKIKGVIGNYSIAIGGIILILISIKMIFDNVIT